MGIPGTIDNDLAYTDFTVGFDTAVNTVLWAINNLRDTMHSHDRVGLLEVMGRNCGDIALYAGVAGGAEYVLVPEVEYDLDKIAAAIKKSYLRGKTSNMIILAEGAGDRDEVVRQIEEKSGIGVKVTNFGYIQRGGSPNMFDRVLAARFGYKAVELLRDDKDSCAIGIKDNKVVTMPFEEVAKAEKKFDTELYNIAHVLSL
jgi:6-phosphofructokinase 1